MTANDVRGFTNLIQTLRKGGTLHELNDHLAELVLAVRELGKKGTLTLTITIDPTKGGAVILTDKVDAAIPQPKRDATLMFPTRDGYLSNHHPNQQDLELTVAHESVLHDEEFSDANDNS